ncbi:uncharacterized protein LOC126825231 [Patella vulgata]|uniref:uncharacterized protein LOC126825231 n=1 Tax=Patella vulgata TaxID=6465 RepID=UPI0024A7F677|nr:uncharacterized protein LOC126825231 [Patella vulgata]
MSSSANIALVDVGETIILQREITGYPRPSIDVESMISPVGVNPNKQYINYTLINATKPHHYKLNLSVYVVTEHYIGKYYIYLKNKHGGLLVCHTLANNDVINTSTGTTATNNDVINTSTGTTATNNDLINTSTGTTATNDLINTSTGIIIIICLLIAVFIIGLVFVKIYYNKIATNTRTIPPEHQYEEVAMQQFSTDRTTLNTNRTLLRNREALIIPSTQTSSYYERPVQLIPHRLLDYDQQENINDGVEDDGDDAASGEDAAFGEDAASDGFNDTNSACLFTPQNGDHTTPKYIYTETRSLSYTRLDRQTMNQRPNSYQELNVQDK